MTLIEDHYIVIECGGVGSWSWEPLGTELLRDTRPDRPLKCALRLLWYPSRAKARIVGIAPYPHKIYMEELKAFLDLLFVPEDTVCVSNSKWAYHSMPISSVLSGNVKLVSPNPKVDLHTVKTDDLTLLALNPIKGFRNDLNVYRHQTFLWECDVGTIASQWDYFHSLGVPYSAAIFSGNKSIHFLTVLDQPIDAKLWRLLCLWGLKIGTLFDQNCQNPSRCVRIPGATRLDTGNVQKLLKLGNKVKLDDFMNWLNKYEHLRPKVREKINDLTNVRNPDKLSSWALKQFRKGIDFKKGRNITWFSLACDLCKSGYSEEEAIEILETYFEEEHDFKEKEFLLSIGSAFKYILSKV